MDRKSLHKKDSWLSFLRRDRDSAALRLRYLDALPRGRLNREWHPVTTFPLCFFAAHPLRKTSFRRAGHQKSTAAALRCHSLICGETEIRTRDTLLEYTRFPGVPLKPLEHLSKLKSRKNGTANIGTFFLFAKKDSMLCP